MKRTNHESLLSKIEAVSRAATKSVFQIARQTRRDIVMIELSELKSMWFGESEKLIEKLFDNYKSLADKISATPILFINVRT
ncbi:MAG: AAA family ATPase [Bacteroidales bacterium]|nr:AAA family ATPase [Bacteroidales bacterium]